jgi:hypothetical protein
MAERRPIYSARKVGQQIGYVEGDKAFDLFDRPCAIYDSNTGLLRNESGAVVGYVSLADIFIGSSWMARDLFFRTGPIAPANEEDVGFSAPTSGAENDNAENLDTIELIAQAHNAARANLSVTSAGAYLQKASMEEHAPQATDFTIFESPSQPDEIVGAVLPSAQFEDSSPEHRARLQDASDADKGHASGEPRSDYLGRTKAEAGVGPQVDASLNMPEPSDESIVESAQPDGPSAGDGMPPAVETFMQHLNEYLHSSADRTASLSSNGEAEVKLSPKAESQEHMDREQFLDEHVPVEDESSDSTQRSGGSLEMAQDNHQQDNSGASETAETHNAQRDMDRILFAVLKVVEKNSSND